MNQAVQAAVSELQAHFPDRVELAELGDGGAKIVVKGLSLNGGPYTQPDTWCGFTITFAYPYADIYPHFVRPDLARRDGVAMGPGFHPGNNFYGLPALMLSRRTRLLDQEHPMSALLKLEKVMQWLICP